MIRRAARWGGCLGLGGVLTLTLAAQGTVLPFIGPVVAIVTTACLALIAWGSLTNRTKTLERDHLALKESVDKCVRGDSFEQFCWRMDERHSNNTNRLDEILRRIDGIGHAMARRGFLHDDHFGGHE